MPANLRRPSPRSPTPGPLAAYAAELNAIRKLFGKPPFDPEDLAPPDALDLIESIENDLEPERLTCDGELPRDMVRQRAALLQGALDELAALGHHPETARSAAQAWSQGRDIEAASAEPAPAQSPRCARF